MFFTEECCFFSAVADISIAIWLLTSLHSSCIESKPAGKAHRRHQRKKERKKSIPYSLETTARRVQITCYKAIGICGASFSDWKYCAAFCCLFVAAISVSSRKAGVAAKPHRSMPCHAALAWHDAACVLRKAIFSKQVVAGKSACNCAGLRATTCRKATAACCSASGYLIQSCRIQKFYLPGPDLGIRQGIGLFS